MVMLLTIEGTVNVVPDRSKILLSGIAKQMMLMDLMESSEKSCEISIVIWLRVKVAVSSSVMGV